MSSVVEKKCEDQLLLMESPPEAVAAPSGEAIANDHVQVTIVERRSGWRLLDLGELWRYRELLFFLAWRDVKVRYKQTVIGATWTVLQPLATMAAFTLFLGKVASLKDTQVPYPLFVFAGLLPWTFFASAVGSAATSVVGNERMLTKIYFPRLLVPLGSVLAVFMDFLIAFTLLLLLMPFLLYYSPLSWGFLLLPVIVLVMITLALGLGVFLSAINVAYRDFRVIVPLALQLWMFATPALYMQDLSILRSGQQKWLLINPLHGVVVNFRAAILGTPEQPFEWGALGVSALVGVVFLIFGCFYFRRVESGFADII